MTVTCQRPNPEGADKPPVNIAPARYAKADTSGLRVRVIKGTNDVTIELTK